MDHDAKMKLATEASKVMFSTMAGVPSDVQLEAALILVKSLFMASVKPQYRANMFNQVFARMRKEIKASAEEVKK